jgi:hypothetical protein
MIILAKNFDEKSAQYLVVTSLLHCIYFTIARQRSTTNHGPSAYFTVARSTVGSQVV